MGQGVGVTMTPIDVLVGMTGRVGLSGGVGDGSRVGHGMVAVGTGVEGVASTVLVGGVVEVGSGAWVTTGVCVGAVIGALSPSFPVLAHPVNAAKAMMPAAASAISLGRIRGIKRCSLQPGFG